MGIGHWETTKKHSLFVLTALMGVIFITACEDKPETTTSTTARPDSAPTAAAPEVDEQPRHAPVVFEAEGKAPLSADKDLARQRAGARAMAALKKKLVQSGALQDGEPGLAGATIVKHWTAGKQAYALARIEINTGKNSLNQSSPEPSKPTETGGLQGAEAAQQPPGGTTP